MSVGMAGGMVCSTPLIAMVAERRGRSCAQEVADREPCPVLDFAADGQGGEHDGQVGLDRVAGVVEHRPGAQVGLGHPEGLLDVPQVVVVRDHLAGGHDLSVDVGDVALRGTHLGPHVTSATAHGGFGRMLARRSSCLTCGNTNRDVLAVKCVECLRIIGTGARLGHTRTQHVREQHEVPMSPTLVRAGAWTFALDEASVRLTGRDAEGRERRSFPATTARIGRGDAHPITGCPRTS